MYAYARAHSIVAKAGERGLTAAIEPPAALSDTERALVRAMTRLPELVSEMTVDYGVHRLTFYGLELAKLWTEFYDSERIIDLPPEKAAEKLYIVQRFITFMDIYWSLLGIEPQQRMEHEKSA
jgi:arginyl-tRNA synthetase